MFTHPKSVLVIALGLVAIFCLPAIQLARAEDQSQILSFEDARHLLLRTVYAPTPEDIRLLVGKTRAEAVDTLLDSVRDTATTPEPEWLEIWPPHDMYSDDMTHGERMEALAIEGQWRLDVKTWWVEEMLNTPSPFTEQLVMFWHNYFTMSLAEIRWPQAVLRNNILLRKHALGNFRTFLLDISRDPGFMIWLDIDKNTKTSPNENYGREIMELYTLGINHYSEQDVIECARALTGWKVDEESGKSYFSEEDHDNGEKTILGRTGNYGLEDVVNILLEEKATARHIANRAWQYFVSHDTPPTQEQLEDLASVLRNADYELRPFFRALFLSDAFWAPENRGNMVKSHYDLILGAINQLQLDYNDPAQIVLDGMYMGQDIMDHLSVAGWPSGREWLNTSTLPHRVKFLANALDSWSGKSQAMQAGIKTYVDAWGNTREVGTGISHKKAKLPKVKDNNTQTGNIKTMLDDDQIQELANWLLARPPIKKTPKGPMPLKQAMTELILDPAYQLK